MTTPPSGAPQRTAAPHAVRDWLTHLRDALRPCTDEAPREAELLLRHVTGLDGAGLFAQPERAVSAAEADALRGMVARRLDREPLPYILGAWEFCGLTLEVTPATLIPRPETETLVEAALAWRRRSTDITPARIVDVGTGSGCIALALATALPHDHVVATDVSAAALAVAARNAARHGLAGRVTLLQGDLLAPLTGPVDLVVANLPYIADGAVAGLQPEVARYEPWGALAGGPDGCAVIRRLLAQSTDALAPGGAVMLEIDPPLRDAVTQAARGAFPRARVDVLADLAGRARVVVIDGRPEAAA